MLGIFFITSLIDCMYNKQLLVNTCTGKFFGFVYRDSGCLQGPGLWGCVAPLLPGARGWILLPDDSRGTHPPASMQGRGTDQHWRYFKVILPVHIKKKIFYELFEYQITLWKKLKYLKNYPVLFEEFANKPLSPSKPPLSPLCYYF